MLDQSSSLEFNSKGYLVNFDAWSKDFAIQMAKEHGVELSDCHWLIINFLRDYYTEYGIALIFHAPGKIWKVCLRRAAANLLAR